MQTKKLFIALGLLAGGVVMVGSTTACTVTTSINCGGGEIDCGGYCADLSSDPNNCGACGASCGPDYCNNGVCSTSACIPDNAGPCTSDFDCCTLFCQPTNQTCGCIPNGDSSQFCNAGSDCCSGVCDRATGYCQ